MCLSGRNNRKITIIVLKCHEYKKIEKLLPTPTLKEKSISFSYECCLLSDGALRFDLYLYIKSIFFDETEFSIQPCFVYLLIFLNLVLLDEKFFQNQ